MSKFIFILKHYLYRMTKDAIGLLIFLALPIMLIAINIIIAEANIESYIHIIDGKNINSSAITISILLMFQFLSSSLVTDGLYKELRGPLRNRLLAAPASVNHYAFGNFLAAVIVSVLLGFIICIVAVIFFNAYFPNWLILFAILVISSVFAQLLGLLMFMIFSSQRVAEAIMLVFAFIMPAGRGTFIGDFNLTGHVHFFFHYLTPYAITLRILLYSGFTELENIFEEFGYVNIGNDMRIVTTNYLALLAMIIVLAVIIIILGRRKPL